MEIKVWSDPRIKSRRYIEFESKEGKPLVIVGINFKSDWLRVTDLRELDLKSPEAISQNIS